MQHVSHNNQFKISFKKKRGIGNDAENYLKAVQKQI